MIAVAQPTTKKKSQFDDSKLLQMLRKIHRQAERAFRGVRSDLRDNLVAEVIANAFVAYRRLVERDKAELAYATPLAMFGIKHVRQGRQIGTRMSIRDVSSFACRRKHRLKRHPLGTDVEHVPEKLRPWQEHILVEDRNATPADTAANRIGFSAWMMTLARRQRRIAKVLAKGDSTQATARRFNLSAGRISQILGDQQQHWLLFQGETYVSVARSASPQRAQQTLGHHSLRRLLYLGLRGNSELEGGRRVSHRKTQRKICTHPELHYLSEEWVDTDFSFQILDESNYAWQST